MEVRVVVEDAHRTGHGRLARRTHEARRSRQQRVHPASARSSTAAQSDVMTHVVSHWPALPFEEWKDTCDTLQLWTQIVGKIRLAWAPPINHDWHEQLC